MGFVSWEAQARPSQMEPSGDWWSIWLIRTGRGWGKTRTGAETTIRRVRSGRARRIALVAPTAADARDIMVDELRENSGILACSPPDFMPEYQPSKRRLVWPNGAVARIFSAEDPDQLRGPQHDWAWCDELAAWKDGAREKAWSNLMFGLRKGASQCMVTTTPQPIPWFKKELARRKVHTTTGSTYENIHNLSDRFIEENIAPYEGTRLGRQELYGDILYDNPKALWTPQVIERNRIQLDDAPSDYDRVVVGVDPPGSHNGHECGIIAGGRVGRIGYALADWSLQGQPNEWATKAIELYDLLEADCIVVESNFGGEMVENTVRLVASAMGHGFVNVKSVKASRSKTVRAEPISGLSAQDRIKHVVSGNSNALATLEDQMLDFENGMANDRVDAYVWTFTDLLAKVGSKVHSW